MNIYVVLVLMQQIGMIGTVVVNAAACDDVDTDNICDDVDDCVGILDECGVCNGTGIADGNCDCDGSATGLCR